MDMLWEEFQWILSLYMKPISFQSKASVVCSVTTAIFIDFCLKNLNVFSQHIGRKTNENLNSTEQIHRKWNVDHVSMLITSWDITQWCSINLLLKELMSAWVSTQALSAPISSLSLLLVQTQVARWKAATTEQLTGAHLYIDIAKSGYLFHGFSLWPDVLIKNKKTFRNFWIKPLVKWVLLLSVLFPSRHHNLWSILVSCIQW